MSALRETSPPPSQSFLSLCVDRIVHCDLSWWTVRGPSRCGSSRHPSLTQWPLQSACVSFQEWEIRQRFEFDPEKQCQVKTWPHEDVCEKLITFLIFLICIGQSYITFLINFLNWSMVDLQCSVSFCYTTKWVSYTYTYGGGGCLVAKSSLT